MRSRLDSEIRLLNKREITSIVASSDIVIELLDVRVPEILRNRFLENIAIKSNKRLIIALNKIDLVPRQIAEEWISFYRERGYEAYGISVLNREIRDLKRVIREYKEMNRDRNIYISIFGAPKVGKSSLTNLLKRKRSASVSRYPGTPGYTRGVQIYKIYSGVYLIDTPGVLSIEQDPIERIIRMSPPERIENPINVAIKLLERISSANPTDLMRDLEVSTLEPTRILEEYALRRGWFRASEPNIREAAIDIIRRYLDGRIRYYTRPRIVS